MTNKEELRDSIKDIENAKLFHDTYESLAPDFGYETRLDTKQFDPFSDNGRLMIETCRLVIEQIRKADMERVVEAIGDRKSIQELIDSGDMTEVYQSHPINIGFKDGWNMCLTKVLSIIKQSHE